MNFFLTIIVPFYNGNAYIPKLFENFNRTIEKAKSKNINLFIEAIIVNDSPNVKVNLNSNYKLNFKIRIINNLKNMGIHYSRVNGLKNANYEWVIFLDQDDELISDTFYTQLLMVKKHSDCDAVLGNGIYQLGNDRSKKIFETNRIMINSLHEDVFLSIRNLIASPGQCIIKRDSIPSKWKEDIFVNNGSDDWFLWLLLFNCNAKILCNFSLVYIHKFVEKGNYSFDYSKMNKSNNELVDKLKKDNDYPSEKLKKLEKSIKFRYFWDTRELKIRDLMRLRNEFYKSFTFKLKNIYFKFENRKGDCKH